MRRIIAVLPAAVAAASNFPKLQGNIPLKLGESETLVEPLANGWQPLTIANAGHLQEHDPADALCDATVAQKHGFFHAGRLDSDQSEHRKYFYWMFESRHSPETAPTVLWLTGGPGCSSLLALFFENGPCSVNADGNSTRRNPFSWTEVANVIWLDQPSGTGFSPTQQQKDFEVDEKQIADDAYRFLQHFFRHYPHYNHDFYILGESYGGHFVPAISRRIFDANLHIVQAQAAVNMIAGDSHNYAINIDLKGIGIGNGLVNPLLQIPLGLKMVYNSSTEGVPDAVTLEQFNKMKHYDAEIRQLLQKCNTPTKEFKNEYCKTALLFWSWHFIMPLADNKVNRYDLTKPCPSGEPLCYDFQPIADFLNSPRVQDALQVEGDWRNCNGDVATALNYDFMKDYSGLLPAMLDAGVKAFVYAGERDFMCNWVGCDAWTRQLEWSGGDAFRNTDFVDVEFVAKDGEKHVVGSMRKFKNFEFVRVAKSGHMVPHDQPQAMLFLLREFLKDNFASVLVEGQRQESTLPDAVVRGSKTL